MADVLPNAPLAEVVFEMRWRLMPHPVVGYDPGFPQLFDTFEIYAKRKGFSRVQLISDPHYSGIAHSVSARFHSSADIFPMLQLGHGVVATNDSASYEWENFSTRALNMSVQVFENYPKLKYQRFEVVHLELRFVNAIEHKLLGTKSLMDFLSCQWRRQNVQCSGVIVYQSG